MSPFRIKKWALSQHVLEGKSLTDTSSAWMLTACHCEQLRSNLMLPMMNSASLELAFRSCGHWGVSALL